MKKLTLASTLLLSSFHIAHSAPSTAQSAPSVAQPPNILFIVADDLSWYSLGYAGDPVVQSPNIDKLAHEGVIFNHAAVTTSICMVSRASLLTGQYLSKMGGARVTPQTWPNTWPAKLRDAGYFGGHIGKVHVQGQNGSEYDFWAGRGGYAWLPDGHGGKIHSIEKDTNEAMQFLQTRPKDKPFFLQLAYTVPHADDGAPDQYLPMHQEESLYTDVKVPVPETATEAAWEKLPSFFHDSENISRDRWKKRFDTPEKYQKFTKDYYRLISGMDRSIGVILDQLKKQGADKNTVVVFIGDNGYFLGEHGLADKWYAYEESLRVPLIVYDPRQPAAKRGTTNDDWVLNVDMAPTFCSLAGVPVPSVMQGRDITPLVKGNTPADWRKDFYSEFKWGSEIIPASESVSSKDWKYIKWTATSTEELFDLRADSHEMHDLSKDPARADEMAEMRARLAELKKEVGGTPLEQLKGMPFGADGTTPRDKKAGKGKKKAARAKKMTAELPNNDQSP